MRFYSYLYKIFLLATFLLMIGPVIHAQSAADKLYGFVQAVVPGVAAAKKVTDDAGNIINQAPTEVQYKYFIYLATSATARIYPIELWIKGKTYSADTENITATPVQHTVNLVPGRPQKTVLVPKTTQKVTQLMPAPSVTSKTSAKAKSLAAANELVVVYKQGGKTFYKTLKTLSELSAKALQ